MVNIDYFKVFSDWLSISHGASTTPLTEVLAYLDSLGLVTEIPKGRDLTLYDVSDHGTLFVTQKDHYCNMSFSGGLLSGLRRQPEYRDFVLALGSSPYNITRLDAALDVPIPTPRVIQNIEAGYPSGYADLVGHSRKLQYILSNVSGVRTGTVYFQDKRYQGNVKLRIYDKQNEVSEKLGSNIPPTTRYELSIGRGASLSDFQDPTSMFWHYMPEKLLKRPPELLTKKWSPVERVSYDAPTESLKTDYETLRYLIQHSVSLRHLVDKCLTVNGGDRLLLREVETALGLKESR